MKNPQRNKQHINLALYHEVVRRLHALPSHELCITLDKNIRYRTVAKVIEVGNALYWRASECDIRNGAVNSFERDYTLMTDAAFWEYSEKIVAALEKEEGFWNR